MWKLDLDKFFDQLGMISLYSALIATVTGIILILSCTIFAANVADFCYITRHAQENPWGPEIEVYTVVASVNWREDPTLGKFKTKDEAVEFANLNKCSVRTK